MISLMHNGYSIASCFSSVAVTFNDDVKDCPSSAEIKMNMLVAVAEAIKRDRQRLSTAQGRAQNRSEANIFEDGHPTLINSLIIPLSLSLSRVAEDAASDPEEQRDSVPTYVRRRP